MAHVASSCIDQGPTASRSVSGWQNVDTGKRGPEPFLVFGQDFKQSYHQSHRGSSFPKGKGRSNVHHAEDDEQYDGQDDWHETYMEAHYENDDAQYYECDDEWDDTMVDKLTGLPLPLNGTPVKPQPMMSRSSMSSGSAASKPWLLPSCGHCGWQGFWHVSRWGYIKVKRLK